MDVIVADMGEYERSKDDPYLVYSDAARNEGVVYEGNMEEAFRQRKSN